MAVTTGAAFSARRGGTGPPASCSDRGAITALLPTSFQPWRAPLPQPLASPRPGCNTCGSAGWRQRRPVAAPRSSYEDRYGVDLPRPSSPSTSLADKPSSSYLQDAGSGGGGNGLFLLLVINLAVFFVDHILHWPGASALYLSHRHPHWWQFITCCFAHANWQHLSSNLFSLYVFGKITEEEGGALGVWLTYLVCGGGGALASYLSQPHSYSVSLGASGAIFGLFLVGVLQKFSWHPRKLVEAFVLGQFVVGQLLQEVSAQAASMAGRGGMGGVSHIAHLGGALAGVLLVLVLSRLPDGTD